MRKEDKYWSQKVNFDRGSLTKLLGHKPSELTARGIARIVKRKVKNRRDRIAIIRKLTAVANLIHSKNPEEAKKFYDASHYISEGLDQLKSNPRVGRGFIHRRLERNPQHYNTDILKTEEVAFNKLVEALNDYFNYIDLAIKRIEPAKLDISKYNIYESDRKEILDIAYGHLEIFLEKVEIALKSLSSKYLKDE